MFRHVCTNLPYPVQVVRIPDGNADEHESSASRSFVLPTRVEFKCEHFILYIWNPYTSNKNGFFGIYEYIIVYTSIYNAL